MDDEVERAGRRFEVVKPAAFYRSEPGEIRRQLPRPCGSAIGDADQSRAGFQYWTETAADCAAGAQYQYSGRAELDAMVGRQIAHKPRAVGVIGNQAALILAQRVDGAGRRRPGGGLIRQRESRHFVRYRDVETESASGEKLLNCGVEGGSFDIEQVVAQR